MPVKNFVAACMSKPVFLRQHFRRHAGRCKVTRWLKVDPSGTLSYVEKREHDLSQKIAGEPPESVSWKLGQVATVTTYKEIFPSNKAEYSRMLKQAIKSINP